MLPVFFSKMPATQAHIVSLATQLVDDMKADGDTWDLERLQGMTLMTRIACKNRFDVLLLLLKKTCSNMFEFKDVLGADAYGNTCLHYFALRNNGRAYEELLSWGLREDDVNNANETPVSVKRVGSLSFADNTHVVKFTPGVY